MLFRGNVWKFINDEWIFVKFSGTDGHKLCYPSYSPYTIMLIADKYSSWESLWRG